MRARRPVARATVRGARAGVRGADGRLRRVVACLAAALGLLAAVAAPAHAAPGGGAIVALRESVTVNRDGSLAVSMSFEWAPTGGSGPVIRFPDTRPVPGDPDHARVLTYEFTEVRSPSGADATLQTRHEDGYTVLTIGSAGSTPTGTPSYLIRYRLVGAATPGHGQNDVVEFPAVVGAWDMPVDHIETVLVGQPGIARVACVVGAAADPCTSVVNQSGVSAYAQQSSLAAGQGFRVIAEYAPGTLSVPEPAVVPVRGAAERFLTHPATIAVAALLVAALAGVVVIRRRRRPRAAG